MTIEADLKALVTRYARYDKEKKDYSAVLSQEDLIRLDTGFIKLINKALLKDGADKQKIKKNYRKLALCFHPDHSEKLSLEAKWLQKILSLGPDDAADNAICFKTLHICYEKLIAPENFVPREFSDLATLEALQKWLETARENSRTYTERHFYASLLGLLHESAGYFDEVGQIRATGIKALLAFLPMAFISFGTFVFVKELFAIYALYFILLKSGQYVEGNRLRELQQVGTTLQQISAVTSTTTTTVLVRLLEMTFWASRQFYSVSLQIGSALLAPLALEPGVSSKAAVDAAFVCEDLILASQNNQDIHVYHFKTAELKMIAAPIESCLGLLNQQFFKNWRAGGIKYRALDAFLFRMRVLDKNDALTIEEKIEGANTALALVKKDATVYSKGGKTALAVDQVERVICLLKENKLITPLVLYHP